MLAHFHFGSSLREQIDGASKSLSRVAGTAGDDGLNTCIASHKADDSRCFQIIERVENYCFGYERAHDRNLPGGLDARADQPGSARSGKSKYVLVFPAGRVVNSQRQVNTG